jgi:demethylmenaquinone methyltransferase/2-methoxy-6-polyprenyl-1,4-benzoquinol methylase
MIINEIFSGVANKYDLMNDCMTFGIHRYWKNKLVEQIQPYQQLKILDVATGTGDIAMAIHSKYYQAQITACDPNEDMLSLAIKKATNKKILDRIKYTACPAEDLPFDDNSFDYYTICFGIRNVTDINKSLSEAHRVLRAGGTLLCMEFSKVHLPILKDVYSVYRDKYIPFLGGFIAKNKDAYEYLADSIRKFPNQIEFCQILKNNNFSRVNFTNYTSGVVTLYSAIKALN